MLAGNRTYVATISIYWTVGYTSLKHLQPAYFGLAAVWIGGLLSLPYVTRDDKRYAQRSINEDGTRTMYKPNSAGVSENQR